jgi:hypothetical protein
MIALAIININVLVKLSWDVKYTAIVKIKNTKKVPNNCKHNAVPIKISCLSSCFTNSRTSILSRPRVAITAKIPTKLCAKLRSPNSLGPKCLATQTPTKSSTIILNTFPKKSHEVL